MPFSVRDEWLRAGREALDALIVIGGSAEEVVPWAEIASQIDVSADMLLLRTRVPANLLRYRANYSRACVAWLLICTVRHPLNSFWLGLVLCGWFHALLVCRGVVHVRAPVSIKTFEGKQLTLMGGQLFGVLGALSALALEVFGCLMHTLALLLIPLCLIIAHAALRRPPASGDSLELAAELRHRVQRALRGRHAESDELEAGGASMDDGDVPPVRDAEMAKRVEQIRQKYRPPPNKLNFD